MRRLYAIAISLALLVATPVTATADTTLSNQQAIDYVIKRALSQRGVPYVYGVATLSARAEAPTRWSTPLDSTHRA